MEAAERLIALVLSDKGLLFDSQLNMRLCNSLVLNLVYYVEDRKMLNYLENGLKDMQYNFGNHEKRV